MEHCTAHNHTRQQHNIHSARYVGQPCAGSCSPKEHGAVRTGSLRNVNNNNNPSPRREIKCYHGADLRASAQRVVSAPISAAHGFWHHKGILNYITHPPTLIRLRHFKNPSLRTSLSINSYSGTPLSQLSFLSSQHPSHHSSILLVVFLSLLILPHPTHTLFVSLSPHILPTCPNQLTPHCSQNLYELLHTYSSSNSSPWHSGPYSRSCQVTGDMTWWSMTDFLSSHNTLLWDFLFTFSCSFNLVDMSTKLKSKTSKNQQHNNVLWEDKKILGYPAWYSRIQGASWAGNDHICTDANSIFVWDNEKECNPELGSSHASCTW